MRVCLACGADISSKNKQAQYCDRSCRRAYNRDAENAYRRQYHWAHRESSLARMREYCRNNPDKYRNYATRRRLRMVAIPDSVDVSKRDWERLVARYGGRCAYCGDRPELLHMEHVVPLSRGGRNGIGNVLPACPPCNMSKGAKLLVEWKYQRRSNTSDVA